MHMGNNLEFSDKPLGEQSEKHKVITSASGSKGSSHISHKGYKGYKKASSWQRAHTRSTDEGGEEHKPEQKSHHTEHLIQGKFSYKPQKSSRYPWTTGSTQEQPRQRSMSLTHVLRMLLQKDCQLSAWVLKSSIAAPSPPLAFTYFLCTGRLA
eukprot:1148666-Pelagomonas_calceolata.AAC.1